jgi:inorganic pyrophosphatase
VKAPHELLSRLLTAHPWHGIAPGDPENAFTVYVEIVPTDTVKYELDKESGHLRVDRPQLYSSQPPSLYGFVPQTYCGDLVAALSAERSGRAKLRGDGDPMDVCVLSEKAFAHGGFLLRAHAIGGLRMIDGEEADDKIIAVLEKDLGYGTIGDLPYAPKGLIDRLRHYFLSYKQIPGAGPRKVEISEVYGRDEAVEVLRRSIEDYRNSFGAPEEWLRRLHALLGED